VQVSERQELWVDLAGERLVDSVLERAAATSGAAALKRRSSVDIARQVRDETTSWVIDDIISRWSAEFLTRINGVVRGMCHLEGPGPSHGHAVI
jgi:hypothetical protein